MAGFQQAANAIVGAPGQIMRSTGIYNELVGKNEELIKELGSKNEELKKKNEDITEKNKTIRSQYKDLEKNNEELENKNKLIEQQYNNLKAAQEAQMAQSQQIGNLSKRLYSNVRARASRDIMLDVVYGEKPTAGPTRDFVKETLKRERKEGGR